MNELFALGANYPTETRYILVFIGIVTAYMIMRVTNVRRGKPFNENGITVNPIIGADWLGGIIRVFIFGLIALAVLSFLGSCALSASLDGRQVNMPWGLLVGVIAFVACGIGAWIWWTQVKE